MASPSGWDAYTTPTYRTPVAHRGAGDGRPEQTSDLNYLRNSVKVVIDAYDGTITYYADLSEPMLAAWGVPGLFTDIDEAPASLAALRYPENLLQMQAEQYTNYHVTDRRSTSSATSGRSRRTRRGTRPPARSLPVAPYYQLLKIRAERRRLPSSCCRSSPTVAPTWSGGWRPHPIRRTTAT